MNHRTKKITCLLVCGVCLVAGWVNAVTSVSNTTTHAVHATLTEALASLSADGQTLALAAGVYEEPELNIQYAVTLQGTGPLDTIIQPAGDTRIASVFIPAEFNVTQPVVFHDLTLRDGVTDGSGGAVLVTEGHVVLTNCLVFGNSAASGGGLLCMPGADASLTVENTIIGSNTATQQGGGAVRGLFRNCTFLNNMAADGGAAAYATLEDCTLTGNNALEQGGGLFLSLASRCLFDGNRAVFGGGAFQTDLANALLIRNTADQSGAALYGGTAVNCTLVGNTAGHQGGGIWGALATNSILYDNHAAAGKNYDTTSALAWSCAEPLAPGTGNIAVYPRFRNRDEHDYSLLSHSPCTNAGSTAAAPVGPDLNGDMRVQGAAVDMGAYEHDPAIVDYYGFELWLHRHGLPIDPVAQFVLDHNDDGIPNGFAYVFGTNRVDGSLFTVRHTPAGPVAETATLEPDAVGFINMWVETTGALTGDPQWVNAIPVTEGAPEGASWFRREAPDAAQRGFFRLKAALP